MERHGAFGTPEYQCWAKMIQRCTNPKAVGYPLWGGRGITICDRWRHSFSAFLTDMGKRPSPDHSIDRIDNNGSYEPCNCRWVLRTAQNRNRRNTKMLTWKGRTMTVAEWATIIGVSYATLGMRLLRHWTVDRTLSTPATTARPKAKGDKRYAPKAFK